MKRHLARLLIAAIMFTVATGPLAAADKAEKKKQRTEAALGAKLKEFDKNGNGKIDDEEKAAIEDAIKKAGQGKKKKGDAKKKAAKKPAKKAATKKKAAK